MPLIPVFTAGSATTVVSPYFALHLARSDTSKMLKNSTGQKWTVFAFNRTNNQPSTGGAAFITANLKINDGSLQPTDDTNPTEIEEGFYDFDLTRPETNGEKLLLIPVSTTSNIQVIAMPSVIYPTTEIVIPPSVASAVGLLSRSNTSVFAFKDRGLTRDIQIFDGSGIKITPGANDIIRAIIGRTGETAVLTITSAAATANGSSFTKSAGQNNSHRLRLDDLDLDFTPGTYTLFIDYFNSGDASEWKNVQRHVFNLQDT